MIFLIVIKDLDSASWSLSSLAGVRLTAAPTHLLLVSLVGELDADVVLLPDLRDDRPLAADDLGMELGVDRHCDLEAAESLLEEGDC